jgi:hypothetical protein
VVDIMFIEFLTAARDAIIGELPKFPSDGPMHLPVTVRSTRGRGQPIRHAALSDRRVLVPYSPPLADAIIPDAGAIDPAVH